MAKFEMDTKEKLELLISLEALLGCVKSLHATVGAVMADVAAIRNTIFDNPEDLAVYRSNLHLSKASSKPFAEEALSCYDDLIQEIVDSQRYQN